MVEAVEDLAETKDSEKEPGSNTIVSMEEKPKKALDTEAKLIKSDIFVVYAVLIVKMLDNSYFVQVAEITTNTELQKNGNDDVPDEGVVEADEKDSGLPDNKLGGADPSTQKETLKKGGTATILLSEKETPSRGTSEQVKSLDQTEAEEKIS